MTDRKALTLTEAAKLTGLSEEALRQRYRRRKLDGYKANDGKLRVYIDAEQPVDRPAGQPVEQPVEPSGPGPSLVAAEAEVMALLRRQIERLEDEVADLRGERDRLLSLFERRRWPGIWPALRRLIYGADAWNP